jgi:hypothetical protein
MKQPCPILGDFRKFTPPNLGAGGLIRTVLIRDILEKDLRILSDDILSFTVANF